jgi:hypothetical protein|tara:strand:- start:54 stop:434 length:381 start_codon:yes stop_codon:yes gene_type:complete
MLSVQDIRVLGQICDTTYGRSSTVSSPTVSIKPTLQGDKLTIRYTSVVHLASERNLREQVRVVEEESLKVIKEYVKNLKKEFKSNAGRALGIKEDNSNDSLEMITTSPHTPRKVAYYRRFSTFTVK